MNKNTTLVSRNNNKNTTPFRQPASIGLFVIIFAFLALLIQTSCCEDNNSNTGYTTNNAQIIGQDFRKCMCCGGWFIKIQQDTLRAMNLPEDFLQSISEEEFPIDVALDWKKMEDDCGKVWQDLIVVDRIRKK